MLYQLSYYRIPLCVVISPPRGLVTGLQLSGVGVVDDVGDAVAVLGLVVTDREGVVNGP